MSGHSYHGQIAGTRWDPNQYLKFSDQRLRPALELLDRVPLADPAVIYDIGCGSGHVTRLIAERWPSATVYGLDNSPEMLAQAEAEPGRIRWIEADIRHWQPDEPPDLLYSNAVLHWVEGHCHPLSTTDRVLARREVVWRCKCRLAGKGLHTVSWGRP